MKVGPLDLELSGAIENERKLLIELMPEVLPSLKDKIRESAIDASDESDGVSAASARVPVAFAVLAAYQLRWIVGELEAPYIGKLCPFMIPCSLVALDHWSAEVKSQGMICSIHLAKNANAAEIGGYADAILDACCQNIASDDDIWHYVVEMSVREVAWRNFEPFRKVLERIITVVRLTWVRNSPHIERLVDEFVILYKDAALKVAREDIRSLILQILKLIQTSKRPQLNATWLKYKDDLNLTALMPVFI